MTKALATWTGSLLVLLLAGCAATQPPALSPKHLKAPHAAAERIPAPVIATPVVPVPKPAPIVETYTVVVSDVPVKELLFSLARDAKINVDVHPRISGTVTLNAIDQTLPQILERIARQVDLRYEFKGNNLIIAPDLPYWRNYRIDYVNLSRETHSEVSVATRIATTGGSVGEGGSGDQGNASVTTVTNRSPNHFWSQLTANLRTLIGAQAEQAAGGAGTTSQTTAGGSAAAGAAPSGSAASESAGPAGAAPTAASTTHRTDARRVVANPISGLVSVFANQSEHTQVQAFVDRVMGSARRQVLIEMTIVEVELSDRYQSGVDWQRLSDGNGSGSNGPSLLSTMIGNNLATAPVFALTYNDATSSIGNISATVKLLETFGDVKVLSSPKVVSLNNQTALLKVVDERVYFTVEQEIVEGTDNSPARATFTSEVHTVPVGLVMSVMPQINELDNVTLSVRPTITRITGFREDPVPKLLGSSFENLIPEIQVREMESLLTVNNGKTIVMGGLMQNKMDKSNNGVPLLSKTPILGNLFSYRDEFLTKTELVIFIRPTIIRNAGAANAQAAAVPPLAQWQLQGDGAASPAASEITPVADPP